MASPKDTKEAPTTAGQAWASPRRDAYPACSPRAAAAVKDEPAHDKSSARVDEIPEMIGALASLMERIETSQIRIEEYERMRGAIESGLISSVLGANLGAATMRIDTLEHPERKRRPERHSRGDRHQVRSTRRLSLQ